MMWSKEFVLEEKWNKAEAFKKQFNTEYAITLEKLPELY